MITPKKRRVHKTVRILPEAAEILTSLAKQFSTSEGQVVEQILITYGPKIMEKGK